VNGYFCDAFFHDENRSRAWISSCGNGRFVLTFCLIRENSTALRTSGGGIELTTARSTIDGLGPSDSDGSVVLEVFTGKFIEYSGRR